ncbi:MAG: hypothetical protein ABIT64_03745 [Lysobacteraceae bacterium]
MKKLLVMLLLVAAMLFSLDGLARTSIPLQSPQHADFTVSGNGLPSLDKVRDAIVQAGASRGWMVTAEQPRQLTLRNVIRGKHTVVVNVSYNSRGVDVSYVSSDNLNYEMRGDVAYIHPKYNEWVEKLLVDIVAKVAY